MNIKAQKELKNWLAAWKNKDYKKMLQYTQLSWAKKTNNELEYVTNLYENVELKQYTIVKSSPAKFGDATLDKRVVLDYKVKCRVRYKVTRETVKENRQIRLLHEDSECNPTVKNGKWGVNPMSALRKV